MASGRRNRRNDGFFPPGQGPPLPPPPDVGWHGPPFPDGHPGYPDPDFNSMGFRPMMEPDYGPMNETGFVPVDHEFRLHASRFGGPRPMMDRDFGPIPDMGHGPVMIREYEPPPPEFRAFVPSFGERDNRGPMMDRGFGPIRGDTMDERFFGSAGMPIEGGLGTASSQFQDRRGMFFGGPRAFPGPPNQDMAQDHGRGPGMMGFPGWVDTLSMPPPGVLPGPTIPELPQAEQPDPQKPEPQKKPKVPPKPSAKPPPGRFQGIISFVGADYGFIERDDLKKIHFSFEAFWGNKAEMIPGVRVQFTVYKDKGKECATDVVVPPGGTEEVDGEILEGIVSKAPESQVNGKSRKLTMAKFAGCILATLFDEKVELSFTTHDYRPTLLFGDRVQFNLLTDLVTKEKRATNIALTANTFQFTAENRETGVVMNMKDGSGSIMSEEWSNLCFDADENLSDTVLRVMDEVEFTVVPVKGKEQQKAVRVKRLPEGTVTFGKKTRERIAEAMEKNSTRFSLEKGKWKAVTSEVLPQRTVVFEDVSSEQYEGTVTTTLPKDSDKMPVAPEDLPGLVVATVAGTDRKLPFGSGDVISEATIMQGDRVQFNIATKRGTKAARATNIEILPHHLSHTQEQRKKGIVMDLRESFGFIRCQQDPQLFFHLKEVMEDSKLNIMDEVEFTVLPASEGEGNQAVRVKKLLWSAFTATPKLEGLGAASKEKKKMTIKLLRDSVNDEMKNLKVKIESFSTESVPEDPTEPLGEYDSSGKQEVGYFIPPKFESYSQDNGIEVESPEKSSPSTDMPQQKKEMGDGQSGAHGGSTERSRNYRALKYRSPAKEHGRKRMRGHRSERRRKSSRSRERSGQDSRKRSRSRERADSHTRKHSSRESAANRDRRRSKSRSPERDGGSRKKVSTSDDKNGSLAKDKGREPPPRAYPNLAIQGLPRSENIVDAELSRKKRELELLEEHIARKRAIMAMEQKGLAPKGQSKNEQDSESGYCRLPLVSESSDKPAPPPIKSILKKRTESFRQQSEIPKKLPLEPTFVSQPHFGPPPVDQPPFLQTSDQQSYFDPPPDRPPLTQSVSKHVPVRHPPRSQSAVHQPTSPFDQPSVCHSPPRQQLPIKSNSSTQFDRFLRTLNKGVDLKLLTSLVKQARQEILTKEATKSDEAPKSHIPPQGEVLYKDEDVYEDSRRRTTEEPDDFLLPHERAFQDGSGFSRIVGMKHGLQVEEDNWREGDVDDEERFLYGERTDEGELGSTTAVVEKRPQEPSQGEVPKPAEDKMQHFDKIQSLLQTIGLDLDISEVSKLTDRTRERLYGKKQKANQPGQVDCESGHASGRLGRHHSQTESDRTHSISPVQTTQREVYMSYQGASEHSGTSDQERFATIARMVQSLRDSSSPSKSSPSSSSSKYSCAPPETYSQYKNAPAHERTYSQQGTVAVTGWEHIPPQPDVQSPSAVPQHPGSYVDPQHLGSYVDSQHPGSYVNPQYPGSYINPQYPQSSDSTPPSCPAPFESAERKQVTTISEDDIKAKQKKRLEQFNERMRQKKEQQKEAMRSRVEREKIPTGKTCTELKNVWICGHSLVFWAEKRAKSPEYGMQLGMDPSRVRVWWKGMQGMTWDQLLPVLLQLKGSWPNPDVIILHLGGNDLGKTDPRVLLAAVKKDLVSLRSIFLNCQLVWSDILPRRSWRTTEDAEAVENYRVLVNRRVRADMAELGGAGVVGHDSIRPGSDSGLYRPDGVHLSGKGIDMFNIDLQDFLEKWEGEQSESTIPS
ncbi:hypothetical protein SKAU_G00160950 [Synaphobranchus kaupii]|uniref:Cold-shock domain-containing protein n=1 Tax=Synaphobranchus kaupii TaxID=118154 RepID=A0A9Q1FJ37_SYNKA|nr:hypothetical protein SKAU_G00160950 [Synaphobranchus kaupii]